MGPYNDTVNVNSNSYAWSYSSQEDGFGSGTKLWNNRAYIANTYGTSEHCEGGNYFQPSIMTGVPNGTEIDVHVEYPTDLAFSMTVCAFVLHYSGAAHTGRFALKGEGGWPTALLEQGFTRSAPFKFSNQISMKL